MLNHAICHVCGLMFTVIWMLAKVVIMNCLAHFILFLWTGFQQLLKPDGGVVESSSDIKQAESVIVLVCRDIYYFFYHYCYCFCNIVICDFLKTVLNP